MGAKAKRRTRVLLESITMQERLIVAYRQAAREYGEELMAALERCAHRVEAKPCECPACTQARFCLELNALNVQRQQREAIAFTERMAAAEGVSKLPDPSRPKG